MRITYAYNLRGHQPVLEIFQNLPTPVRDRFEYVFKVMREVGHNIDRHMFDTVIEGNIRLREVKAGIQGQLGQHILLGDFREGDQFVVATYLRKQADRFPARELRRAQKALIDHDTYLHNRSKDALPSVVLNREIKYQPVEQAPEIPQEALPPEPVVEAAPSPEPESKPKPKIVFVEPIAPSEDMVWQLIPKELAVDPTAPLYKNVMHMARVWANSINIDELKAYLKQRIARESLRQQAYMWAGGPLVEQIQLDGALYGVEFGFLKAKKTELHQIEIELPQPEPQPEAPKPVVEPPVPEPKPETPKPPVKKPPVKKPPKPAPKPKPPKPAKKLPPPRRRRGHVELPPVAASDNVAMETTIALKNVVVLQRAKKYDRKVLGYLEGPIAERPGAYRGWIYFPPTRSWHRPKSAILEEHIKGKANLKERVPQKDFGKNNVATPHTVADAVALLPAALSNGRH